MYKIDLIYFIIKDKYLKQDLVVNNLKPYNRIKNDSVSKNFK